MAQEKDQVKQYDLIVIGSGGGAKLVRPAADLGYRVAVIEEDKLGGTCLNRGCIPSKMLIHAADIASHVREAKTFDVYADSAFAVGFAKLVSRVSDTIDRESESIGPLWDQHENITLYRSHGRFVSDRVLEVAGEQVTADKIVLAVGAKAHIPHQIENLANTPYLTYTEALRLTKKPKKLVVIGGGYIATELGYFFSAMNVETHFFVRSRMLRKEDKEVQEEFERVFNQHHPIHYGAKPTRVDYANETFLIHYLDGDKGEKQIEADALLVATGVVPHTKNLGLEHTSVSCDSRGFISVNDSLQAAKGIWAFGDCIGRNLYRHTANFEGEYLFRTLFKEKVKEPISYSPIPHAIFTYPQVAGVGKKEQELIEEGVDYVKGVNSYRDSAMGMALLSDHGFVKLLFERATSRLIGAHIVGDEASNMIHMLIAYMNMGACLDDLLRTIYIHPALPEVVRNAARKAKHELDI